MKKEILAEASKTRTFGYNRVADGVYPIVKMATYNRSYTDRATSEEREFEAIALFFDEDETVLELNFLTRAHFALNDDGTPGTHIVRAGGTLLDRIFANSGKTFYELCAWFNEESGLVGKFAHIEWMPYRSANADFNGPSYFPVVNFYDTKEAAEAAMNAA